MEAENMESRVRHALSEIVDPETGLNIMRMDLIHDLTVTEDGEVGLVFRPSSPVCPMAYSLANSIKKKIESLKDIRSVRIAVENFQNADRLERLVNQ
ncbi:MAG TPA: iron-sulfur cluster assembly protein [Desulfomonilaceae bacterium]|nr:iron-sulfur cluster assembly protein [Desulfomonilaceae bacterium]